MKVKIKPEKILGKETRLDLEKDIVYKMISMYCKGHGHGQEPGKDNALCQDCTDLFDYAVERLENCPFGEAKTFCSQCPVHCYAPEKRAEIKKVMAWSGPRMIFRHPVIALVYLTKKMWYN